MIGPKLILLQRNFPRRNLDAFFKMCMQYDSVTERTYPSVSNVVIKYLTTRVTMQDDKLLSENRNARTENPTQQESEVKKRECIFNRKTWKANFSKLHYTKSEAN